MGKHVMRWFLLSLMLIQIPLLSGCWSRIELEEQAFVPTMGIDKATGNSIKLTVRVAVPSKLSGGGGGGSGGGSGEATKVVTVQARTVGEAISLLSQTIERTPSFSHCAAIVFGEDIAKDGITKYLRSLAQYREFRRTMFIFTAKGPATDIFKSNKPVIEQSPTRFVENMIKTGERTGMLVKVSLNDYLINSETPHINGYTMLIAANPTVKKESKKQGKQGGETSSAALSAVPVFGKNNPLAPDNPGDMKRQGGNPLEYIGTALYKNGKFIGQLSGEETQVFNMVQGNIKRANLTVHDPFDSSRYVTVMTTQGRPPNVEVKFKPDRMHPDIRIAIRLEGDLFGEESNTDFTKQKNLKRLQKSLENSVEQKLQLLVDKLRHDYNIDPLGFGTHIRPLFWNDQDFLQYDWHKAFDQATVHYDVKYELRRTGIQGTPPVAKER